MLDKKAKARIIKKFKTHESDTGSSQVQIAILSEEIKQLTKHLKDHKKDFSSRRGLLRKVSERRKLLHYLYWEDAAAFDAVVNELKIKIARPHAGGPAAIEEEAEGGAAAQAVQATDRPSAA